MIGSPQPYQVFQRVGEIADINISGFYIGSPTSIEARWNGGEWTVIDAAPSNGVFTGTLTSQPQGQGTFEIRFSNTAIGKHVNFVGIGDVFAVAGQSNASGRGSTLNAYIGTPHAGLLRNDYKWSQLLDPTDDMTNQVDTVSVEPNNNEAGSVWPLIASNYLENQSIPIAFIPCAAGGSSITAWQPGANHQNRSTLYGSMVYRVLQTGGCRAVLWWQGEADTSMSGAAYNTYLDTIADAIATDIGCKLMPCKFQTSPAYPQANQDIINAAIGTAWSDNANVLTGPDLTILTADNDDGFNVHLISDANVQAAASLWWTAIKTAFGW